MQRNPFRENGPQQEELAPSDTCPLLGINVFPSGLKKAAPSILTGQAAAPPEIEYSVAGQMCLREACAMWDTKRDKAGKDGCLVRSGLRCMIAGFEAGHK